MAMPNIQGMETEYKPWGGLAGIMTGEREGLQHFANLQGMEGAQLDNVLKQVEASRAANDFSNPEMERWRQAELMGKGMQQDALGRLKQGTLDTDVSSGNQKNQTETLNNQMKSFLQESDLLMSGIQSGSYGPATLPQLLQNASPQMRQLAQMVGPDKLFQILPVISEKLKYQLSQTPELLGNLEKQREQYSMQENIHQGDRVSRERIEAAGNSSRAADRAAQREATQASKDQSDGMRKEQELTRRMEHGRQKLKLLQDEYNQIDEAIVTPVFGMTKEEKAARKGRLEKQKKDIKASAQTLVAEMDRLNSLSSFSSGEGTASKPIKLD